ncbi:hypothetical protein CLAIMM_07756 [Cladophialophora immunda]|nr:hypothetical protein CLAIMM_07756 [Cladophialophora immunda]
MDDSPQSRSMSARAKSNNMRQRTEAATYFSKVFQLALFENISNDLKSWRFPEDESRLLAVLQLTSRVNCLALYLREHFRKRDYNPDLNGRKEEAIAGAALKDAHARLLQVQFNLSTRLPKVEQAKSRSLPPYVYDQLHPNREMRVLSLLPGTYKDQLRCTISRTVPGTNLNKYCALSFAWGEGERDHLIICDDVGHVSITKNLWDALRHVRHSEEGQILWVDQICIDQANELEKVSQIMMMGQIFSCAEQVLIWLGEEQEQTCLAYELLEDIACDMLRVHREVGLPKDQEEKRWRVLHRGFTAPDHPEWVALRRLLDSSWFSRLWIVQEIMLARRATIQCGPYTMDWEKFRLLMNSVIDRLAAGKLLTGQRCHSWDPKENRTTPALWFGHPLDDRNLLALVRLCQESQSTEPNDKIYGLLGLADDVDITQFPKVYGLHFRQAYASITRWFIQRYGDLQVLGMKAFIRRENFSGCTELPSWVPDYRSSHLEFFDQHDIPKHGLARLYNASGSSTVQILNEDSLRLTLHGLPVGSIAELSKSAGKSHNINDPDKKVISAGGAWSQSARRWTRGNKYMPTMEPTQLAYYRICIGDNFPSESVVERRERLQRPNFSVTSAAHRPRHIRIAQKFPRDNRERMWITLRTAGQKLLVTETGYIGMAGEDCVIGDQIWVLMGYDHPVVLRKLGTDTYEFKGQCYIHGIMDGEFLLNLRRQVDPDAAKATDQTWLDNLGEAPWPFQTQCVTLV